MQQVPLLRHTPTLLLYFPHLALLLAAAAVSGMAPRPGCPSTCGDVYIPYPFGIGDGCAFRGSDNFNITCNDSFNPPSPFLLGDIEIVNISLESGEMRVFTPVSYICYNSSNTIESSSSDDDAGVDWDLSQTHLMISPTRNEFTAIGCDTVALLEGKEDLSYFTGCITSCVSVNEAANDGDDCAGLGCCKTNISPNLSSISVYWNYGNNTSNSAWNYSPCSYAFVSEKGWYNFSRKDLIGKGNNSFLSRVGDRSVKLILDWVINDNGTCDLTSLSAPACVSENSFCYVNATKGAGYLCKCSDGYSGNPYITGPGACTNINECELLKLDPAKYGKYQCGSSSTCYDNDGNYTCKCNFGHKGDGKSDKGCQPILPGYVTAILVAFVAGVVLVLLLCLLHKERKRRLRRGFSEKNGDEILKRMNIRTFTEDELEKITNHYSSLIGNGHFGKVFKGTTNDNQLVAVKRPIEESEKPLDGGEFVAEITFQFKIKHENLVRLIGCCLETIIPRLVFEFIPNGSLYDMLHGGDANKAVLTLPERLDIAIGSAEALSYMHSHGDNNHVHGDIKSANILLGTNLKPKVSDFGSAKLLSVNNYATCVAADGNYIDPVYYKTGRFTVKSDVYSFGVVLLELITRKMPRYGDNSLTIDFDKSCKVQGNGRHMYDAELFSDDEAQYHRYMECLDMVGRLAVRCINGDADERPTMAEVAEDLKQAKSIACKEDSLV